VKVDLSEHATPSVQLSKEAFRFPDEARDERRCSTSPLAIHRREIFGFLGPSGTHKSTTQNVLIGLLDDSAHQAASTPKSSIECTRSSHAGDAEPGGFS
jgi:ABC-type glutathione transport system ATPase component